MAQVSKPIRLRCACATGGNCDSAYCPNVAKIATREAHLPADSPGARAADRLRPWSS